MNLFKRFQSETPRIISIFQMILTAITSISGTLAVAGVVINPVVGTGVAVASGIATGVLQLVEKTKEIE